MMLYLLVVKDYHNLY